MFGPRFVVAYTRCKADCGTITACLGILSTILLLCRSVALVSSGGLWSCLEPKLLNFSLRQFDHRFLESLIFCFCRRLESDSDRSCFGGNLGSKLDSDDDVGNVGIEIRGQINTEPIADEVRAVSDDRNDGCNWGCWNGDWGLAWLGGCCGGLGGSRSHRGHGPPRSASCLFLFGIG